MINTDISGVYLLFYKDKIVYVGRSGSLNSRIWDHHKLNKYKFDSYVLLPCDEGFKSYYLERKLILHFKPKYNVHLNPKRSINAINSTTHKGYANEMMYLKQPKNTDSQRQPVTI
jgi:excinuclease UvrABC nuclease subunit